MVVELIDPRRVRVALDAGDMRALGVTCRDLLFGGQGLVPVLKTLLRAAREAGFACADKKLFIEVYPDGDGGCALCFTGLRRPRRYRIKNEGLCPCLFRFSDADVLFTACRAVYRHMSHRVLRSSLYYNARGFTLSVRALDAPQCRAALLLREFGESAGKGRLCEGVLREHSRLLLDGDAIDVLARPSP